MVDTVVVREVGDQKFVISQEDTCSFRAAVCGGKVYLCVTDIAKCCGFKAPGKVAPRLDCDKVKLDTRVYDGARGLSVSMWYMALPDAIRFVKERSIKATFSNWFLKDAVEELRELESPRKPPAPEIPKLPQNGGNVALSALVDRMIAELLTFRQEIS